MRVEYIEEKLKQAVEDIKRLDFVANIPKIMKHMDYIYLQ